MTREENQVSQEAFNIINQLASLCATVGVEVDTQKQANTQIRHLLAGVISNTITKLGAQGAGLITR